ncbi:MAG: dienelactone hydrolase family protein [Chloroflexota bacterium]
MSDYLAKPKSAPRGGILLLHAWWGLNNVFKNLCDRLAAQGYLVLTPDLYEGEVAATIAEAEKLRKKRVKVETASRQILASLKQLKAETGGASLGLIGFSLGAYWALWLAQEKPKAFAATVLFYGTRGGDYAKTRSAFLGHFAESDEFVADSGRKKFEKNLKAAGKEVAFHVYPKTRHWFFESDRPEYDPSAATLAWERTLDFLRAHLT